MNDLYWIITLGNARESAYSLCAISLLATLVMGLIIATVAVQEVNGKLDDCEILIYNSLKKWAKIACVVFLISLLAVTFMPTKRDLYAIYGIGTVVDYAKGNKELQKLPDNAVKAINTWIENLNDTTNNK